MPADTNQRYSAESRKQEEQNAYDQAYIRPEGEDDDGYDPYSDRRPSPEPLFEADPWA